jgi:hypothetical protein
MYLLRLSPATPGHITGTARRQPGDPFARDDHRLENYGRREQEQSMVCHAQGATSVRPRRAIPPRPPTADLTIDHAIGLYLDSLIPLGVRDTTLITQGNQLRRFFGPALAEPLRTLSTERLQQLIDALAASRNQRTGAPLTSVTLATCREAAQRFTRWCTAQGRLSADPMVPLKKKTLAQLHAEISQLRADLEAMQKERDEARQQLHARGAL